MNYANTAAQQLTSTEAKNITMDQLYRAWQNLSTGHVIVDIRKPEDYATSHVPGSINMPFADVDTRCNELRQYNSVCFYCYGGPGSKATAEKLAEQGFENLYYVGETGFSSWEGAGLPVEK